MTNNTRSRTWEYQLHKIELEMQELAADCHRKVTESNVQMERRLAESEAKLEAKMESGMAKLESGMVKIMEQIKSLGEIRNESRWREGGTALEKGKNVVVVEGQQGDQTPLLPNPRSNTKIMREEAGMDAGDRGNRIPFPKYPRLELNTFAGEGPREWLRKCNKFFSLYQISEKGKMDMVEFYVEGKVDVWFQSLRLLKPELSWGEFSAALLQRFGGKDGNDTVGEFNKLVQRGNVIEYVERFEELRALMLCQNSKLTEEYFISSFISGLKEELKPMVWMMNSGNLMAVFEIAQWQERTVDLVA